MKKDMIKVVKIEVGEPPQIKEIANELDSLQEEVGGLIECVYLEDGCLAIVIDEVKINLMQPNRWLGTDIICGPFFICGDSTDGDFASLSDEEIEKYSKQFANVPTFTGNEPELEARMTFIGFDYFGGM